MGPQSEAMTDDWIVIEEHPEAPRGYTAPYLLGKCFKRPQVASTFAPEDSSVVLESLGRLVYKDGHVCEAFGFRPRGESE